ncbi:MAG: TM2 domain-containing protein [Bacteroidales bacterium]
MMKYTCLIFLFLMPAMLKNADAASMRTFSATPVYEMTDTIRFGHYRVLIHHNDTTATQKKRSKLIAIAADLLTGPLGGHRIYLGTKPWIPVVYAVTLGGGIGLLPVIDLFAIIFVSDLNKYTNNPQIFMWL